MVGKYHVNFFLTPEPLKFTKCKKESLVIAVLIFPFKREKKKTGLRQTEE